MQQMQAAGKEYRDKATANPKWRGAGPPFLRMWTTMIKVLGTHREAPAACNAVLETYWAERIIKEPQEEFEADVKRCRLKEAHSGDYKLQFMVSAASSPVVHAGTHMTLEQAICGRLP